MNICRSEAVKIFYQPLNLESMHGIVFAELRKFVNKVIGVGAWLDLLEKTDLKGKIYLPTQPYPDEDIVKIVKTACEMTEMEADEILEAFGKFITPDLMSIYRYAIKPEWKTMDFLENVENIIHRAVRMNDPDATPAELTITKHSNKKLEILYTSRRKMHSFGLGIIKGVAEYYGEDDVEVSMQPAIGVDGMVFMVSKN